MKLREKKAEEEDETTTKDFCVMMEHWLVLPTTY